MRKLCGESSYRFIIPIVYSMKWYRILLFYSVLALSALISLHAQDLAIDLEDILIEQRIEGGGYHLYVRKKPEIGSIMLTESTRDPLQLSDNFSYRALEWNAVNGDEIRILDEYQIPFDQRIYSLIDSTPEPHPGFGEAFHIFIPYILVYGYSNTRNGELYVTDGTYINIRSFSLPYGDYRGAFQDNSYVIRVTQYAREGPPQGNYNEDALRAFGEIAELGRGDLIYSVGTEDLSDKIQEILERARGNSVDLVLCLDTTASMRPFIDPVRRMLIPMLESIIDDYQDFRIGMVLYKDYNDEYLARVIPFTRDFEEFERTLNAIRVSGGRDIPEAVYEALHEGATKFPWMAESRLMILIGDAPPHPRPRGRITKDMVDQAVEEQHIQVSAIIIPN